MSMRRLFGRVEAGGLLHRDVVIRLEDDYKIETGTRVAIFEVAELPVEPRPPWAPRPIGEGPNPPNYEQAPLTEEESS